MRHWRPPTEPFELVATVGPASLGRVRDLLTAGASKLRLNASHLRGPALRRALRIVLSASPPERVVVDLQGAKMRLGTMSPRRIRRGTRVRLALVPRRGEMPLPHPELFAQVAGGEVLSADDGRLRFEVIAVGADRLEACALTSGVLQPRKGLNLADHPVRLDRLIAEDREAVAECVDRGVRSFALSFMQDAADVQLLTREAPGCRVTAKLERGEALRALRPIARQVHDVWICRGDLQEQVGPAAMAAFVASLDPRRLSVPVLMAGQVLQSLRDHLTPFRSEVCHLYDLIERGYAGVVLSDETAVGSDPVGAVRMAVSLWRDLTSPPR
jgi:pyruvate kinase